MRVGVLEIEAELLFLVGRIERRRGAGDRRGQKRDDRRQAVRQRDADAIASADAGGGELFRERPHLIGQSGVGDGDVLFRKDEAVFAPGTRSSRSTSVDGVALMVSFPIMRAHALVVC